MISLLYVIF